MKFLIYSFALSLICATINAEFFSISEHNTIKAYCYYLSPMMRNHEHAWESFHNSAFDVEQMLQAAHKDNVAALLVLPAYHHNISPLSPDAPFLEGARCALTWAHSYACFAYLGNIRTTIILYDQDDIISPATIAATATSIINEHTRTYNNLDTEKAFQETIISWKSLVQRKKSWWATYAICNFQATPESNTRFEIFFETEPVNGRVLISGGAGFLGSHCAIKLLAMGYQVIVMDNLSTGNLKNLASCMNDKNFKFINHDVSKPCEISRPLTHIIHAASLPSPAFYYTKPRETLVTGLHGTKNLLDMARKHQAQLLFASTSEVYGDPEVHPQYEDYAGNVNPIGKRSHYDQSKRGGETLLLLYHDNYDIDVRMVRIFNTYGPHMDLHDGRVVTNFIKAVLQQEPITVYGTGLQTRSFAYADDTVDGILKLMLCPTITSQTTITDRVFNIGTPEEFTINELAQKVTQLAITYFNRTPDIRCIEQFDSNDPKIRKPDISKAKKMFGFDPTISIDQGLEKTFLFFCNNRS